MATRSYTRHNMPPGVNDSAIDPVFQLQQTAFEVPPPPTASLSTSSLPTASLPTGGHDEENLNDLHQADDPPGLGQGYGDDHGHGRGVPSSADGVLDQNQDRNSITPSSRHIIPPDLDTSTADLTYRRNRRDFSANNPSPEGWLYPHKKGIGTGSNLEAFKADIEARTQRGENCKTIADALNAMGVQTSDRAVSRVRIKWGMRKRAQRKQKTPPPDSEAARISAKSKVQALRKIEITRMTRDGMTAEEIYENLTSRGMELKKGVATVLRLQSAWKLTHNEKRWVENFRHQRHKQAKAQQLQAFRDIARELDVEDVDAWLAAKMSEDAARQARHELALKLMGEHAPKNPERRKLQRSRKKSGTGTDGQQPKPGDDSGSDSDTGPGYESEYPGGGAVDSYAPLDDQTDIDMDDDGDLDEQDNAAKVATDIFSRAGTSLSQPTSAARFAPMFPTPALPLTATLLDPRLDESRQAAPMSSSQPASAPASQNAASNRRVGRTTKQPIAKPASISALDAPSSPIPTAQTDSPYPAAPPDPAVLQHPGALSNAPDFAAAPATPAPALVLRPEEAEANKTALSTLDQYNAAAQAYKEILQARNENKPLPGTLTGLPPSSKEVDAAKRTLKEVTQAMMLSLD